MFFVCRKACVIGCTPIPRSPSLGIWWWQYHAALCASVSQQFNRVPTSTRMAVIFFNLINIVIFALGSDSRIFTIHYCIVQVWPYRMTLIRDIRGTSFTLNQWYFGGWNLSKKWMGRVSSLDIQTPGEKVFYGFTYIFWGSKFPNTWCLDVWGVGNMPNEQTQPTSLYRHRELT